MREQIRHLLAEALPLVDIDSPYLYEELDSLAVTTILMTLSDNFGITLDAADATPKHLQSLDTLVALVKEKQGCHE